MQTQGAADDPLLYAADTPTFGMFKVDYGPWNRGPGATTPPTTPRSS